MAGFVLYLLASFDLGYRMVELHPKTSIQQSSLSIQPNQQHPLTTKDTKDTKEDEGLPLMNADERGVEGGGKVVQIRGRYGYNRVRFGDRPGAKVGGGGDCNR